MIKNLSSLRKLFTICSAEKKQIIDITKLDNNPAFKDEYIELFTLCVSLVFLLTNLKTPLSRPINAKTSAILVIAFPSE